MQFDPDYVITEAESDDHGFILCDYTVLIISLIVTSVLCLLSLACNLYSFMRFWYCRRQIRIGSECERSLLQHGVNCNCYTRAGTRRNKETKL